MKRLGDWELGEPLGEGGQAEVFRAIHRPTGLPGAIRVAREPVSAAPAASTAWVAAVGSLDHPAIARALDAGFTSGRPRVWLAHELLDGGSLADRADQLDWPRTAYVLRRLLEGLAYAHAHGLVHRDVKPENVLFPSPTSWDARLVDFGLALPTGRGVDRPSGGTPAFAAPEQFLQPGVETPGSDLYAVGAVAWWCVTGRPPFGDHDVRAVLWAHRHSPLPALRARFSVPDGFAAWVGGLLQKSPALRPGWAQHALTGLLGLDGQAPEAPSWRSFWPPVRPAVTAGLLGVRQPPTVGREEERDRLWELFQQGAGRVVIRGPRGSGRRTLAGWLGKTTFGLGLAYTALLPSGPDPIAASLAQWLRLDVAPDELAPHVEARLFALGFDAKAELPLYLEAAQSWRSTRTCAHAAGLLRRLWTIAGRGVQPLVLLSGDGPQVRFADALRAAGLVRTVVHLGDGERPADAVIELGPLPVNDAQRLIRALAPLSRPDAEGVAGSGGLPNAVLTRLQGAVGHAQWVDGALVGATATMGRAPPPLEPHARLGLDVAICMDPFRVKVWRAAVATLGVDPDRTLRALVDARHLEWSTHGFSLAEGLDLPLDPARSRVAHAALAQALAASRRVDPVRLGHHLLLAGEVDRALELLIVDPFASDRGPTELIRAANAAITVLQPDDPRVGTCLAVLAVARSRGHDPPAQELAVGALESWIEVQRDERYRALALHLRGWGVRYTHPSEARRLLERALALGPGPELVPRISRTLADLALEAGDPEGAITRLRAAMEGVSPLMRAHAATQLAWVEGAVGRPRDGLATLASIGPPPTASAAWTAQLARADLYRWLGQLDQAAADYDRAAGQADLLGLAPHAVEHARAWVEADRGRTKDAEHRALDGLEQRPEPIRFLFAALLLALRAPDPLADHAAPLVMIESLPGAWDPDARRHLERAIAAFDERNSPLAARTRAVLVRTQGTGTGAGGVGA